MIYLEWYFAGPLLGLILLGILVSLNIQLGVSSSLEFIVETVRGGDTLKNTKGKQQLYFVGGLVLSAGLIFLTGLPTVTELDLKIYSLSNGVVLGAGAFLIGFGSRFANGCTAGHCIMGLSIQAKSSLIATIGFFAGGLISTYFINELILTNT